MASYSAGSRLAVGGLPRRRANREAMAELTAQRTLVKSPPELWEELSEVERLAKHLDAFGDIKITKLDPEHTVAWEGEHASGTVSIEPSGWGTKVLLTAALPGEPPEEAASESPTDSGDIDPPPDGSRPVENVSEVERRGDGELETAAHGGGPESAGDGEVAEASESGVESDAAADTKPSTLAVAPESDPHSLPRRGLWSRLGRWLRGEELGRPSAREPHRAAWVPPALEGPAAPAPEPETRAVEPGPDDPENDAPAAEPSSEQREDDAPTAEPASEEPAVGSPEADRNAAPPANEPVVAALRPEPAETPPMDQAGAIDAEQAQSVLDRTLDTLGSAHHRPFSRG
jgi:hypothetical protein